MIFGAAFGFLDLIEMGVPNLPNDSMILETGGMKTFRREMTKENLHQQLADGFGVEKKYIHSEYGMTELLSQAYSNGGGVCSSPPGRKIVVRESNDPLATENYNRTGVINVIDLANLYTCSFIATQDVGRCDKNGNFEVLGRLDNSDIRGCNLMII